MRGQGRGVDWAAAMSRDFTFPRAAGANSTTTKSGGEIIQNRVTCVLSPSPSATG